VTGYSVTSNRVKLLKHLDALAAIQQGRAAPVMLHLAVTNHCNMNCTHCCFGGRDRQLELSTDKALAAIRQFHGLGVRALEHTGGGEPTMHPGLDVIIRFAASLGMVQGMCTNGSGAHRIHEWGLLRWVRVSLNVLDLDDSGRTAELERFVAWLKERTDVSACYVVGNDTPTERILRAVELAEQTGVLTRLTPDCLQPTDGIAALLRKMKQVAPESDLAFVSDFNVTLHRPRACTMHMLKPFVYPDGWVYPCPSAELSNAAGRDVWPELRLCRVADVDEYYRNGLEPLPVQCQYCKYAEQCDMLMDLLEDTDYNEFV